MSDSYITIPALRLAGRINLALAQLRTRAKKSAITADTVAINRLLQLRHAVDLTAANSNVLLSVADAALLATSK